MVIETVLGKPFASGSNYAVYNLDCVPTIRSLPAELTLTNQPSG